jgi:Homeodomain-like domain
MRYPGRPHRWDRDSIQAALRAWLEQTGSPPRRQDWSGERPDGAASAQRKWMKEHPRWPSSSCVAAHFGSWGKALQAAGLSGRSLTFEDTVVDRVEAAWRLAASGHPIRAIAEQLGVSVSTVHNYLRARTCPDCGGPVPTPRAERCIACTAHEPTVQSPWTREAVRDAIRAWTAEHGRPPRYHEWTPSRSRPGRWERESPRWPSAAVVCDVYRDRPDPWNAALAEAGAAVGFRRWSDEAIRFALAAYWTRSGRAPTAEDLRTPEWPGPTASTLRRRYGSVERAWQALGPVPA